MERDFLEQLGLAPEAVDAIWQQRQLEHQEHQKQLRLRELEFTLRQAVDRAGGRNLTAIRSLVDEQAVFDSDDMAAAAKAAVDRVKGDNPYLFRSGQPYAAGTGTARVISDYSMDELGAMPLQQYRALRRGSHK